MNTLDIIVKYGLSIRQIPLVIYSSYNYKGGELKDNQKIKVWKPELSYFLKTSHEAQAIKRMEVFYQHFPEGRTFITESKVPENAGYWMCKQVLNTDSMVRWNSKVDNLSPTLEESVNLFLKSVL